MQRRCFFYSVCVHICLVMGCGATLVGEADTENGIAGSDGSTGKTGIHGSTEDNGSLGGQNAAGDNGATANGGAMDDHGSTEGGESMEDGGAAGDNGSSGDTGSTNDNGSGEDGGSTGDNGSNTGSTGDSGSTTSHQPTGELEVRPLVPKMPPTGQVPVALAIGNGRIATSCDRGQSWAEDWIIDANASDHSDYAAAAGGAFGAGVFVVAMGWGAPGRVLRSTDGLNWDDLDEDRFHLADGTTGRANKGIPVVFYDGSQFVIIWDRRVFFSPDGMDWHDQGVRLDPELFHIRQHSFQKHLGRFFMRGENSGKDTQWMRRSSDSGLNFTPVTPDDGFDLSCGGQTLYAHLGLITNGGERYCLSLDGGLSWSAHRSAESFATIVPTSEGFLAFAKWRRQVFYSSDAVEWESQDLSAEFRFSAGGYSPHGYYIVASKRGPEFYRSDDGKQWVALPNDNSSGVSDIRHVVFGHASSSARCPAP